MKKILSIDAGGMRGIIPAIILAEIEARAGRPVCQLFDFFAGTSTGGMLALGLNCPASADCLRPLSSASDVEWLFHQWGNRAFGNKSSRTGRLSTESTSGNRIEEMFREYFADTPLTSSIKPTMVTAFDLVTGEPFFFNSARNIGIDALMWQAARATTAIPPHFPPLRLHISPAPFRNSHEACLVDGSIFASNPAACALAEAHALFPGEPNFFLVSLGCGAVAHGLLPVDLQQNRRRILNCSLTAQSACVDYQMRALLPPQHYIRIQAELLPGLERIDDTSKDNLEIMDGIARETIARCSEVLNYLVDVLAPNPMETMAA